MAKKREFINFAVKKIILQMRINTLLRTVMAGVLIAGAALCMNSKGRKQTKQSTFTITTTELCRNIRGYRGPVPVSVTFSKGKITDIKLLPNHETPSYFQRVERSGLVKKFIGLTAKQAATKKVDAVTGATYSSQALIKNIQAAAREAQKR